MMYRVKKNRTLSLGCALALLFQATLAAYSPQYVEDVNNQRLSAYGNLEPKKIEAEVPRTWWEWLRGPKFTPPVQERTKREVEELLCKVSPAQPLESNPVIDISSVGKMELVRGEEKKHLNLISYVTTIPGSKGKTESAFNTRNGLKTCAEMLTQPATTFQEVQKNPCVIKAFLDNPGLSESFGNITHRMKYAEEAFLDFFAETQPSEKQIKEGVYFGSLLEDFNRSPYALEARTRLLNLTDSAQIANMSSLVFAACLLTHLKGFNISPILTLVNIASRRNITPLDLKNAGLDKDTLAKRSVNLNDPFETAFSLGRHFMHKERPSIARGLKLAFLDAVGVTLHLSFYIKNTYSAIASIPEAGPRLTLYGLFSAVLASQAYLSYSGVTKAIFKNNINAYIQGKMIGAATYINSIRELYVLAKQDPQIVENMPELEVLECLIESSDKHSEKFNQLIALLNTSTCKGSPSFFSITGRALAAYTLMQDLKDSGEFAEILRVAGKLETLWAMARVVKAHENTEHPYCFVEFVDQKTPYIKAEDFANPFVPAKYSVANSIEMNNDASGHIILTGPNTGGKSTLIKALWINTLLAQSFGIAYAKSMVMTPFYKLSTYLNITDNVSEGISLFKAEIKRARELRDLLTALKPDQFMFIIMDEMFSGTAPEKAQEISYEFISHMSEFNNCLFIDATHFSRLNDLEKTGMTTNYHMDITPETLPNGSIRLNCTYKLLKGASQISNAMQLVKDEGISW